MNPNRCLLANAYHPNESKQLSKNSTAKNKSNVDNLRPVAIQERGLDRRNEGQGSGDWKMRSSSMRYGSDDLVKN
jgi:hypothetical protein